jgi:uncharacterized glyoxalase superfamily protein PhnB
MLCDRPVWADAALTDAAVAFRTRRGLARHPLPARRHGARVLQELTEYEYGERECTVEDLAGHRWQFTQTIRDVAPEEWGGVTVQP